MAIKDKEPDATPATSKRRRRRVPVPVTGNPPARPHGGHSSGKPQPPLQAEPEAQPAPTIRKGIYLSALIYIEGDQPAPEDFIALTTATLSRTLDQCLRGDHNGLSMALKRIEVRNDIEQDGEEQEERFQF